MEASALVKAFQNFETSTRDGQATLTKKEMVMSKVRKQDIFLDQRKNFRYETQRQTCLDDCAFGRFLKDFFFTLSNKTHLLLAFFFGKKTTTDFPGRTNPSSSEVLRRMTIMGLLGVCSKFLSQDEAMKPIHTAIEDGD